MEVKKLIMVYKGKAKHNWIWDVECGYTPCRYANSKLKKKNI